MKKTLLTLSAALLAGTSMATVPGQLAANKGIAMPEGKAQSLKTERISLGERAKMVDATAFNGFKKAPVKADEDFQIITEAPAGEDVMYVRDAYGWYVYWFYIMFGQQDPGAANIVWGEDGYAYLHNPFSGMETNSYLKCEVKGDKLVAQLPQPIYTEEYDGEVNNYYADILCKVEDAEGNITYVQSDTDEVKTVSWTIDGDELTLDMEYDATPDEEGYLPYPDVVFGMISEEGEWGIYGDCKQTYTKFTDKKVEAPVGLEWEDWMIIREDVGYEISVGFDGNDVYLSNLSSYLPDAVVKGTIEGDKVVFESNQYEGQTLGYYIYFMGGTYDENYYYLADNITFSYDADKKVMTSAPGTAMYLNASKDRVYYLELYVEPEIKVRNLYPNPVPGNPIPTGYSDYFETYDFNYLQFTLPNLNVDNDLLNTANMYYEVFIDDELWEFEPDENYWIEEPMTKIPYDFTDGNSFYTSGASHTLYLYFTGYDTIGLQLFNEFSGETFASDKIVLNVNTGEYWNAGGGTGVESIASDKVATGVEFYNLNGVKVANPSNGIFVCKKTFEDGTSKVSKVFVK